MMDAYQSTIAAAVLVIAGLTIGFLLGRDGSGALPLAGMTPASTPTPSPRAATPPPADSLLLSGPNAIAVNDQKPGLQVGVSMVVLSQDGWVVIHESEDGKPGRILGAKRFSVGTGLPGTVELLRPTEEGKVYFAMLHADDGDRQFDHAKDLPVKDPQGNAILMRFVASSQLEQ